MKASHKRLWELNAWQLKVQAQPRGALLEAGEAGTNLIGRIL